MIKKLRKIIVPFIVLLICVISLSVKDGKKVYAVELNGTPIESSYALNGSFRMDKSSMKINGEDVAITGKKIYFPNNTVSFEEEVSLNYAGRYTVEYTAVYEGKTYVLTESFEVYDSLYSFTSLSDVGKYGSNPYEEDKQCLNVALLQGSTFYFNPIIDFSDKTKEDEMISINITPERLGVADFGRLYIRLTDVYDENNYVTIMIRDSVQTTSYVLAGASSQGKYGGTERGIKGGKIHYGTSNGYGFASHFSFTGYYFEKPKKASTMPTKLYFDYAEKAIYAETNCYSGGGRYVISLKEDFDVAWKGFTTGEARLSVFAGNYVGSIASIAIDGIYDYDLSQTFDAEPKTTKPIVDLEEYTETTLPLALVGNTYPVFNATFAKKYGNEKLYTTVYYNYNGSSKYVVESKDGYFIPDREGVYTIEYAVVDKFGQKEVKTIEITATKTANPIQMQIASDRETVGTVAHSLALADYQILSGGYGTVKTVISLERENGETVVSNLSEQYMPYESGTFNVVYTATDFVGQKTVKKYAVTIENGEVAVFEDTVVLPQAMVKGMKYTLPSVFANDYTSGTKKQVQARLTCEGGTLTGYDFIPSATQAIITYTATVNGKASTYQKTIPVLDVGSGEDFDISKYFITDNLSVVKCTDKLDFILSEGDKGALSFAHALIADNMVVNFTAPVGKPNILTLTFVLRDIADAEECIRVKLSNTAEGTTVCISGGEERKISAVDITSSSLLYQFKYDGFVRFGTTALEVLTYENGETFNGFSSGKIYLSVEITGEVNNAGVSIKNINGQPFNSDIKADGLAPTWTFAGEIGGRYDKNSRVVIPALLCLDVLNPQVKATLTVESKTGVVTDENGTVLQNVDAQKEYAIMLSENGMYMLNYTYEDGAGNSDEYSYFIAVRDNVHPQISVNMDSLEVKVGESFTIATATATDDVSKERKIQIKAFLVDKNGIYREIENGDSYTIEKSGHYKLIYMAIDEAGNYTKVEVSVTAS